jgi:sugar lactone lactonase YvrE
LAEVAVASRYVTSCCFGGAQLDELYITSATVDDPQPHAGKLFVVRPGVRGKHPDVFRG